jgi:hypothetical protein
MSDRPVELDVQSLREELDRARRRVSEARREVRALETLIAAKAGKVTQRPMWRDRVYRWAQTLSPGEQVTSRSLRDVFPDLSSSGASLWMSRMVDEGVLIPHNRGRLEGQQAQRIFVRNVPESGVI